MSLLAPVAAAIALAGCGSSSPAQPAAAATAAPHPSAHVILRRMRAALRHVHTMNVVEHEVGVHGRRTEGWLAFARPGRMSATVKSGSRSYFVRAVGKREWVRESSGFWVLVPPHSDADLQKVSLMLQPAHVAQCVVLDSLSGLRYAGSGSIDGVAAWELTSRGVLPGTAKGHLWVSSHAPYLPLREVQTSTFRKGARAEPFCDESASDRSPGQNPRRATTTFRGFDAPTGIRAPKHIAVIDG